MLKFAIYCNVFILFLISALLIINAFMKDSDLKKIKRLLIIYMIFNIISYYICSSDIVDTGWDLIMLYPITLLSFILHVIGLIGINKKIKKSKKNDKIMNTKKFVIITIIPVIIFIIPYIYELYIINNCNCLLRYNYQEGMITSDDTYIAIINNKPVTVTLQKNLFNRKGYSINGTDNDIVYKSNNEILPKNLNGNVKKIAVDVKEKCPSAKEAYIYYVEKGNFAFVNVIAEENSEIIGEYFYYNNKYIKNIHTLGDIENITYYK